MQKGRMLPVPVLKIRTWKRQEQKLPCLAKRVIMIAQRIQLLEVHPMNHVFAEDKRISQESYILVTITLKKSSAKRVPMVACVPLMVRRQLIYMQLLVFGVLVMPLQFFNHVLQHFEVLTRKILPTKFVAHQIQFCAT
jgi:hypothetical protein